MESPRAPEDSKLSKPKMTPPQRQEKAKVFGKRCSGVIFETPKTANQPINRPTQSSQTQQTNPREHRNKYLTHGWNKGNPRASSKLGWGLVGSWLGVGWLIVPCCLVDGLVYQLTDQPTSQPTNQSTNQPSPTKHNRPTHGNTGTST